MVCDENMQEINMGRNSQLNVLMVIYSRGILGNKMPPRGKCPEKANFFRKWSVMIPTFEIHNLGVFLQVPNWPN